MVGIFTLGPRFHFPHEDAQRVQPESDWESNWHTHIPSGLHHRIGTWTFCTSIPQYQWRIGSQTPCKCQNLQMLETLAFGPSHLHSTFADTEEWLYWGSKHASSLFWRETSSPFSKTLGQTTIREEIAWNICKQYRSMQDPEICRIYPRTSLGKNTRSLLLRIFLT